MKQLELPFKPKQGTTRISIDFRDRESALNWWFENVHCFFGWGSDATLVRQDALHNKEITNKWLVRRQGSGFPVEELAPKK
jgi:hypothetical protein